MLLSILPTHLRWPRESPVRKRKEPIEKTDIGGGGLAVVCSAAAAAAVVVSSSPRWCLPPIDAVCPGRRSLHIDRRVSFR